MNEALKVQPRHLERGAYLYVRQSSMRQVMDNVESTKRQYAFRGRVSALGWRDDQVVVIDSDQGESGASASWREGFQRLVTDVGMGRAGIVMGLEVSRLARNNADWHRLLEICALADTLILDEDGVYDPASFNDRLLLGLKGTMSEAEFHVLKARLRGGILNKVRRGEYRCSLPTGLIYDDVGNDGKKLLRKREHGDWLSCIPDAHPGYIAWEQLQQNLQVLEANGRGFDAARGSSPRGGGAAAGARRVRPLRQAPRGSLRRPARQAGGMVCLRPGAQLPW